MAVHETGKQRAIRIPLDYYKQPTWLEYLKDRLGGLALLVSVGWLAIEMCRGDVGNMTYSRGPVANVHQTWEANCTACHEPFTPIQKDHWAMDWIGWFNADQKCQACHAGPKHHANEKTPPSCAACHREHGGRDASLVRLDDRDCTQCHADLGAGATFGAKVRTPADMYHIRGFSTAAGHGDFQHLKETPQYQKLRFNHKLHMAPDLITPENGDPHFTLDKISEFDRLQFDKGRFGYIQLECASCHQLDSQGGYFGGRTAGDYMLPVRYQAHCQACHPLTYERKDNNDANSGPLAVPHGIQPREIRQILQGVYTAKAFKDEWSVFERKVPARPLPGKQLGDDGAKAGKLIGDKVAAAEKNLYLGKKTCGECHYYEPAGHMTDTKPPVWVVEDLHFIARTNVPQVWFQHARFNHAAHRGVECRSCHANAYARLEDKTANGMASRVSDDILIPGMDICVKCHAPQTKSGGAVTGGARFDCTECHRYHGGNLGASQRDPVPRRGIDAFLNNQKQEP